MACVIGCSSIGVGVVLLVWPDKSVRITELLLAVALFLTAAWQLTVSFRARINGMLKALEFFGAVLSVVLGLLCMHSGGSVALLAMWIGMAWMVRGIVQAIVAAWSHHLPKAGRREGYGLVTLLAGVIVLVWPIDTVAALSVLVGVGLIVLGAMEIRLATRIRRHAADGGQVGVRGLLGPRADHRVRVTD
ncbi:HdeD family acid-resistance protein [Nocardia nova]|uniref:HdeD family acid-resistance protein n=1 Tax=Nocardia nova TaxID=37330 RepID=UPI0033D4DDF0